MATNWLEILIALAVVLMPMFIAWVLLAFEHKQGPAVRPTQIEGNSSHAQHD